MALSFRRRVIEPEILEHAPPEVARRNLADLVRINRFLGGHGVIRRLFGGVVGRDEAFSVLDVGAGSGDTARLIGSLYPKACVVSLDLSSVHVGEAPDPRLVGDAFRLPFERDSFDFVMSSLFLHHFTDEQVVSLLRSFDSIARRGVLIADLERHVVPYFFLPFSKVVFRWGFITVHDGKISVRAAFRGGELKGLAERAGICNPCVKVHRPAFRVSLVGLKEVAQKVR